jgi:hypothetical protein
VADHRLAANASNGVTVTLAFDSSDSWRRWLAAHLDADAPLCANGGVGAEVTDGVKPGSAARWMAMPRRSGEARISGRAVAGSCRLVTLRTTTSSGIVGRNPWVLSFVLSSVEENCGQCSPRQLGAFAWGHPQG